MNIPTLIAAVIVFLVIGFAFFTGFGPKKGKERLLLRRRLFRVQHVRLLPSREVICVLRFRKRRTASVASIIASVPARPLRLAGFRKKAVDFLRKSGIIAHKQDRKITGEA